MKIPMKTDNRKNKVKPVAKANTLAILDSIRKADHSKVTIATEQGLEDAKDWVEDNQK